MQDRRSEVPAGMGLAEAQQVVQAWAAWSNGCLCRNGFEDGGAKRKRTRSLAELDGATEGSPAGPPPLANGNTPFPVPAALPAIASHSSPSALTPLSSLSSTTHSSSFSTKSPLSYDVPAAGVTDERPMNPSGKDEVNDVRTITNSNMQR